MKFYLSAITLYILLGLTPAFATVKFTYDPDTGNLYNTYIDTWGNTFTNGYNTNSSSNWNTTVLNNCHMNGYNKSGHYWQFNPHADVAPSDFGTDNTYETSECTGLSQGY